jgi:ABC-2 type transport system ATP-binding protein
MDAIVAEKLSKTYKRHLGKKKVHSIDGLDLRVAEGEVYGFLGRNGAGKTTTIKILCSLMRPSSGKASIMGRNVATRRARSHVGYLPENPYFYEYLTPRETIDFYGRLNGLSASQRGAEWEKLSALLDLESIADQRVRGFSKGMRQRLGFAVALVGDPPVVILDEPMSGLDPLGRRLVRELMLRLRDEGKTLFFSSHVLGDVQQICDRVGILVKGRLASEGSIGQLLNGKVKDVEVVASGLKPPLVSTLTAGALATRESESGMHFRIADIATANEYVKVICKHGGTLVEFTPEKDSLEDYFMHHQELQA